MSAVSAAALVVFVAPDFAPAARDWIEKVRKAHDPNQKIAPPHVTVIFPAPGFVRDEVFDHVARVAATFRSFDAVFDAVETEIDAASGESYVYLMPKAGKAELVVLRERLMTGPLADAEAKDRPYRPHLTLGRFRRAEDAEVLARRLSAEMRVLPVKARGITSAAYDGHRLDTQRRTPFGGD